MSVLKPSMLVLLQSWYLTSDVNSFGSDWEGPNPKSQIFQTKHLTRCWAPCLFLEVSIRITISILIINWIRQKACWLDTNIKLYFATTWGLIWNLFFWGISVSSWSISMSTMEVVPSSCQCTRAIVSSYNTFLIVPKYLSFRLAALK